MTRQFILILITAKVEVRKAKFEVTDEKER